MLEATPPPPPRIYKSNYKAAYKTLIACLALQPQGIRPDTKNKIAHQQLEGIEFCLSVHLGQLAKMGQGGLQIRRERGSFDLQWDVLTLDYCAPSNYPY